MKRSDPKPSRSRTGNERYGEDRDGDSVETVYSSTRIKQDIHGTQLPLLSKSANQVSLGPCCETGLVATVLYERLRSG